MRWKKAHLFLKGEKKPGKDQEFRLSSNKIPPTVVLEFKPFEEDVKNLSENIKFENIKNIF